MRKSLFLITSILVTTGLAIGYVGVAGEPERCDGVGIGDAEVNTTSTNETLELEGLYCARYGGFTVENETLSENGDQIEASISIEGLDEGMAGTTAITPVNFNMSDEFDPGEYDLTYKVEVDGELIESGEKEIQIGEIEETSGILNSLSNWFSDLF